MTGTAAAPGTAADRLPYLDGLRGAAALAVLVYHVAAFKLWVPGSARFGLDGATWMAGLGNYGVCVFFLLSGLVLYRPFAAASLRAAPSPEAPPYLARRVLRIYPAYVVALTAWYALGAFPLAGKLHPQEYVWQYLLLQNHVQRGLEASMPVAWTLSIEVTFYFALPLIAAAIRRLPGGRSAALGDRLVAQLTGLLILTVVAVGYRRMVLGERLPTGPGQPTLWLPNHLDWFALGMLLAVLHAWRSEGGVLPRSLTALSQRPLACWASAVALYWLMVGLRLPNGAAEDVAAGMLRFTLSGVSAFLLLLPAVLATGRHRALGVLDHPVLAFAGVVSYGIYLWHTLVLQAARQHHIVLPFGALVVVTLALTLGLSVASHRFLERPILRAARSSAAAAPAEGRVRPAVAIRW